MSRYLEGEMSPVSVGIEGWFTLRAVRRSGRVVRERKFRTSASFHNLITTLGMNRFGNEPSGNVYRYCHVGTGTATPAFSDTQLATFLANVTDNYPGESRTNSGSPDYYSALAIKWTSAIGALGNNNLTEVGVSGQNTNGLLFSRELIRDSGGDPTSFPIADDEQLEVIYELRMYPKLTDTEATITIGATSYDTVTKPLAVNSSTWWGPVGVGSGYVNSELRTGFDGCRVFEGDPVDITGDVNSIADSLGEASSVLADSYVNDTFYRNLSAVYDISTGNGNIKTAQFRFGCAMFQTSYDPVIVKDNTQVLTLRQRIAWARRA